MAITSRLGGVHRGGENCTHLGYPNLEVLYLNSLPALDVSADLQELARCPVGLVSSGVKSILDIGRYVIKLN